MQKKQALHGRDTFPPAHCFLMLKIINVLNPLQLQVVAEDLQLLNTVQVALPFLITTSTEFKDVVTEEVRLRYVTTLFTHV